MGAHEFDKASLVVCSSAVVYCNYPRIKLVSPCPSSLDSVIVPGQSI